MRPDVWRENKEAMHLGSPRSHLTCAFIWLVLISILYNKTVNISIALFLNSRTTIEPEGDCENPPDL